MKFTKMLPKEINQSLHDYISRQFTNYMMGKRKIIGFLKFSSL